MSFLSEAEVRRLLAHVRQHTNNAEQLAELEDELHGEFAEEFLREPDLLKYFPELIDEIIIAETSWTLRIIPHAHLRMVQRGIGSNSISSLFSRFIEKYAAEGHVLSVGHYSIVGRAKSRAAAITVRADVDVAYDQGGQAHVVTVYLGRGDDRSTTEVTL